MNFGSLICEDNHSTSFRSLTMPASHASLARRPKTPNHPAMTEFADPPSGKDEVFPIETPDPKSGITKVLAHFVATAKLTDVGPTAVSRLKDFLLDFVGATAWAGRFAESSPAVLRAIRRLDPDEEGLSTVIGEKRGYTESYAAFLNASHAHSIEFDDTNRFQTAHPGCVVVAATLAEAERIDATGKSFFEALAVGYEIACRVGQALGVDSYYQGFHMTCRAHRQTWSAKQSPLQGGPASSADRPSPSGPMSPVKKTSSIFSLSR